MQTGLEILRDFVSTQAPQLPGVYHMYHQDGSVLYIGKAKNLKNRLGSYLNFNALTLRQQRMISLIDHVRVIVTGNEIEALLQGKSQHLQQRLAQRMFYHSEHQEYEKAAQIRDRIQALTNLQTHQLVHTDVVRNADLWILLKTNNANVYCVYLKCFRNHYDCGAHTFFPQHDEQLEFSSFLHHFCLQFYHLHPAPEIILFNTICDADDMRLLSTALTQKNKYHVDVMSPERGAKKQLMHDVEMQAHNFLRTQHSKMKFGKTLMQNLSKSLKLSTVPKRIEIYDNSHHQGAHAYGVMVVASSDGFMPQEYRRFSMSPSHVNSNDDCAMMRHMLKRRWSNVELPQAELILIDGGMTQWLAAHDTLKNHQLTTVPVIVAIAKGPGRRGPETLYTPTPIHLPSDCTVLHFIQRLRDEAHRFAISTHRRQHRKTMQASFLTDIDGLGPKRRQALLHHFGSWAAIQNASVQDLHKTPRISEHLAKKIYAYFHHSV